MYRRWKIAGGGFQAVEGFNSTARYERVTNTLDGSLSMERVVVFQTRWTAGGINAVIFCNSNLIGGSGWFIRNLNGTLGFGVGVSAAFVNSPAFSLAGHVGKIVIAFCVADGANVRLFRYDAGSDTIVEVGAGTSMGGAPVYTAPGGANLAIGNRGSGGTSFPSSIGSILSVGGIEGANLSGALRLSMARTIVQTGRIPDGVLDLAWSAPDLDLPDPWPSSPAGSDMAAAGTDLTLLKITRVAKAFV